MPSAMLIKLYDLNFPLLLAKYKAMMDKENIRIFRPIAPNKIMLEEWVMKEFGKEWASEFSVSISAKPATSYIAVQDNKPVGFASYDCVAKDMFGPTGVLEQYRGKGIGAALLINVLHAMYMDGYVYTVIGSTGPVEFYAKVAGAIIIEENSSGNYSNFIK
jgi:GNAT superfamily N-acetyltransferase